MSLNRDIGKVLFKNQCFII